MLEGPKRHGFVGLSLACSVAGACGAPISPPAQACQAQGCSTTSTSAEPFPSSESSDATSSTDSGANDETSSSDSTTHHTSGESTSGGSTGSVDDTQADSSSTGEPGFPSSSRHEPRPLGYTAAPNGYWEYLPPAYDDGGEFPLLVFWHGVGENGNGAGDLDEVLREGPPRLIDRDQWPAERPFVVLSPQHPGEGCPSATEIQLFLAYAMEAYSIDTTRVYLTGLSCGAIGGWNYLAQFGSSQVAATVLIAGDGRSAFANAGCALGAVPIWAFHGDADGIVSVQGTIDPIEALLQCEPAPAVQMTIYSGVGHTSWRRTYDLSAGYDIYEWLLQAVQSPAGNAE